MLAGFAQVMIGVTFSKVKLAAAVGAELPVGLATMTSKVPASCGGAMAVICVAELTMNDAATPPNVTDVVARRLLPVMVTTVPPGAGPLLGALAETAGGRPT